VHIDYAFDAPQSQTVLQTLQDITMALVSKTIAKENCSLSTPFTWQTTLSPRTLINASVVVCTLYQQQQLLSVLSTNNVLCELLNCVAETMAIDIAFDAAQFDSMGIMFYGVSSTTTTRMPVAPQTTNATHIDDVNYFGSHGSRLRIGLMLIIGTLAVVAALLGCAVMCIHACRRRRRRRRKHGKHLNKHHALTSNPEHAHAQSTVLEMGVTGPMVIDASMVQSLSQSGNQVVLRQQFDEYDEDDERMPIGIDGLDDEDDDDGDEDSLNDSDTDDRVVMEGTHKGMTTDDKGVFVPVLDEESESDSTSSQTPTQTQTQSRTGNDSPDAAAMHSTHGHGQCEQIPHANLQSVQTAQSDGVSTTRCPCSCHLHSANCNMDSPMLGANSVTDTNTNTNTNTNCNMSQCALAGCNGHFTIPGTTIEALSPNPPNVNLQTYEALKLHSSNMYMHPALEDAHHEHKSMINPKTGNAALWECVSNEENAMSDASKTRSFALV